MAYNGFLLKVGTYTFPMEYINYESYKATLGIQDLDAYRDGNGALHRNALDCAIPKIEFQLRENITNKEFDTIMANIRSQYTKAIERKANVRCFMPEIGDYIEYTAMYMPDIEVQIKEQIDNTTLKYKSIRIAWIAYGYDITSLLQSLGVVIV